MKTCTKCNISKKEEEYYKKRNTCKECMVSKACANRSSRKNKDKQEIELIIEDEIDPLTECAPSSEDEKKEQEIEQLKIEITDLLKVLGQLKERLIVLQK